MRCNGHTPSCPISHIFTAQRLHPRHLAGKRNKDHWWVASQDRSLRGALGQLAAAPCIHMSVNGLHLEQPSDMAKSHVKQASCVLSIWY